MIISSMGSRLKRDLIRWGISSPRAWFFGVVAFIFFSTILVCRQLNRRSLLDDYLCETSPSSPTHQSLTSNPFPSDVYEAIRISHDPTIAPIYPPGAKRQLIFCISTGHTGTSLLAELMKTAFLTVAFHERGPHAPFYNVLYKGRNETKEERRQKVTALEMDLDSTFLWSPPYGEKVKTNVTRPQFFADISHMFIKTQWDVIVDRFYDDPAFDINVIVLRRYLPEIVRSHLTLQRKSWRAALDRFYGGEYTLYHRNIAILEPTAPYEEIDDVEKIIGYALDFEYQTEMLRQKYPKIRFHDLRSEDLFVVNSRVRSMMRDIGMVVWPPALEALSQRQPLNPHYKQLSEDAKKSGMLTDKFGNPLETTESVDTVVEKILFARILKSLEKHKQLGHRMIPIPHLHPLRECPNVHDIFLNCEDPIRPMSPQEIELYSSYRIYNNTS